MKFILYRDRKREWRWRLKARNGRVIADSAEGYKRKRDAEYGVLLIQAYAAIAEVEGKRK